MFRQADWKVPVLGILGGCGWPMIVRISMRRGHQVLKSEGFQHTQTPERLGQDPGVGGNLRFFLPGWLDRQ